MADKKAAQSEEHTHNERQWCHRPICSHVLLWCLAGGLQAARAAISDSAATPSSKWTSAEEGGLCHLHETHWAFAEPGHLTNHCCHTKWGEGYLENVEDEWIVHLNVSKTFPIPHSPLYSFCVPMCLCRCGVQGIQYYDCALFCRFYVDIFVDLVKHGVLTLIGEVQHYKNDCYFCFNCCYLVVLSVFNHLFYKSCTLFVSHLTSSMLVSWILLYQWRSEILKRLVHDIVDAFSTHASLVYDIHRYVCIYNISCKWQHSC